MTTKEMEIDASSVVCNEEIVYIVEGESIVVDYVLAECSTDGNSPNQSSVGNGLANKNTSDNKELPSQQYTNASGDQPQPKADLKLPADNQDQSSYILPEHNYFSANNEMGTTFVPSEQYAGNKPNERNHDTHSTESQSVTVWNELANDVGPNTIIVMEAPVTSTSTATPAGKASKKTGKQTISKALMHFACAICDFVSARQASLEDHIRRKHTGDMPQVCTLCDYKTVHEAHLKRHMRTHTGEKPFSCPSCEYRGADKNSLTCHMRRHTGDKPFICPHCDFRCSTGKSLRRHVSIHTGIKPYQCTQCEYRTAQKGNLRTHMRTHTGVKPYACTVCSFKASHKATLVSHMRTHPDQKSSSFTECDEDKTAKTTENAPSADSSVTESPSGSVVAAGSLSVTGWKELANDVGPNTILVLEAPVTSTSVVTSTSTASPAGKTSKKTGKPAISKEMMQYACAVCVFKTSKQANLENHIRRRHTGDMPHACTLCDYKAVQEAHLKRHMRTHTGEKPFSCLYCEYRGADKNSLTCHMRRHTGDKPFACPHCEFRCSAGKSLRRHVIAIHTSEKPYHCELCPYKTADKGNLRTHMRTHTGVKPYACGMCSFKAAHKATVVAHMRTHSSEKPYACTECNYKSSNQSSLKGHMMKAHGESKD